MSPEDPLTAAAQRLRDLTGHQGQRDVPWTASWRETTRTYVVYSRTGRVVASTASEADAQYLAALASPDRVLLLAALLAAIAQHDRADDPHEWETCFIAVRERADALASHLTEGTET